MDPLFVAKKGTLWSGNVCRRTGIRMNLRAMYEYIYQAGNDPWSGRNEPPFGFGRCCLLSYDAIHTLLALHKHPISTHPMFTSYAHFHHMSAYFPHGIPLLSLPRLSREANHALDRERRSAADRWRHMLCPSLASDLGNADRPFLRTACST